MAGNPNLPKENIDEVILRLLALEPNEIDELDYETYNSYLRELLVQVDRGKKIDSSEVELIRKEFKRIKGKKGRFKLTPKRSKVTVDKLGIGGIRKQIKGTQKRLMLAPVGGVPAGKIDSISKGSGTGSLARINDALNSIVATLTSINTESRKRNERDRKDAESKKRTGREKELESRPIEGIKKVISAITKPFQSIWDKIVNFITMIVLGRIVLKLIDWFADKKNQDKIQSIIRFFGDHWPTLLALYLRFGTGIGRFIGRLSRLLVKGAVKLVALTAKLAAKAGLKGAGRFARFLGGPRGAAIATGLGIAADVAITAGAGAGISGLASGDMSVPGFSGGGFNGGLKNFFGNMFSGLVSGPKGRDKVPAMLTDGEFVMSTGAVQKYGVDTLEAMNAAGGGTNIPKIASGVTYAAGGGQVGGEKQRNLLNPAAKTIFDRLVRGGLTPTAAAGIVANIGVETGHTYNPSIVQQGGGPGRGLVQWEKGGRFDTDRINLMSFAKSRGTSWNNLNTQVDFILHELNNHPEYKRVKARINAVKDVPTATKIFLREYEKAGTPHVEDRLRVAQQLISAGYLKPPAKPQTKPQQPNVFQSAFQGIANIFSPQPSVAKPRDTTPRYAEGGLVTQPHIQSSIKPRNIRPLPSPKPEIFNIALDGTTSSGGVNPSLSGSKPPSQSPTHGNTRLAQATLGVNA